MLVYNNVKVLSWTDRVSGINEDGISFEVKSLTDPEGDSYFILDGEAWYRKEFLIVLDTAPVRRMLDLSTDHLFKETLAFLKEQSESNDPGSFIVTAREYGFFFPVFLEENEHLPEDLAELLNYALLHNCEWVLLDSDGPIVAELTHYSGGQKRG